MATLMRRHGDVLIKTTEDFQIPKEIDLSPIEIVHKGANHDHFIKSGNALMGEKEGKKYLRVIEDVVIDHEEHGQGDIPKGDHWVEIKSEYDHLEEESRQVVD